MNVIELLTRRVRQRSDNAADVLAAAAKAHAAGSTVDFAAVEAALFDLREGVEHFDKLCETAARRRDYLADLEKLPSATSRHAKAEAATEAEKRRFDDLRSAHFDKMRALEAELKATTSAINKAEEARAWLTDPANAIGSVADRLKDAIAEHEAASADADRLRRELRQHESKLVEADRWIASIRHAAGVEIAPTSPLGVKRGQIAATVDRDCEPHELTKKRARRRIDEATPLLKEAEDRLARAERALAAAQLEALKG